MGDSTLCCEGRNEDEGVRDLGSDLMDVSPPEVVEPLTLGSFESTEPSGDLLSGFETTLEGSSVFKTAVEFERPILTGRTEGDLFVSVDFFHVRCLLFC